MTQRQNTILGFITLAMVLIAIWLLLGDTAGPERGAASGPLFPGLAQRINEVDGVAIIGPEHAVTIEESDGGAWVVVEKDRHPAEQDKVRRLLTGLARSEIVASKTANPERFGRIGLAEEATRVTLTADGAVVAALLVGEREFTGNRQFNIFVKPVAGDRALLVDELPEVDSQPRRWLPAAMLELERDRIASVRIEHADGQIVELLRNTPEENFALVGKADNETYAGMQPANRIADAYVTVPLDDVRPLDELDPQAPITEVALRTFDGLTVEFDFMEAGEQMGDAWIAANARYEPIATAVAEEEPGAIQDEAQRLDAAWEGWAYRVPSYKIDQMVQRREDLIESGENSDGS